MEAGHKHFMKFISDEVQFKIPKYQRLYDWKNEHCKTLLDDMKNLLKMEKIPIHFVGSIVYIDEEGQTRVGSTQKACRVTSKIEYFCNSKTS